MRRALPVRQVLARCALVVGAAMGWCASAQAADLVVNADTTLPFGSYAFGSCVVSAGHTLFIESDVEQGASTVSCASLTVGAGAAVRPDGQGHPSGSGPGGGIAGAYRIGGGGGAHAGDGATGSGWEGRHSGGVPYASLGRGLSLGSPGGASSGAPGGAGGGALRIQVAGLLTVDGVISADGAPGAVNGSDYAHPAASRAVIVRAGAGGSGWLECGQAAWCRDGLPVQGTCAGAERLDAQQILISTHLWLVARAPMEGLDRVEVTEDLAGAATGRAVLATWGPDDERALRDALATGAHVFYADAAALAEVAARQVALAHRREVTTRVGAWAFAEPVRAPKGRGCP